METGNHGGGERIHTFIESRSWQMTNTWFDETTMKKLLYIVPWSWLVEAVWANLAVILDPSRRAQTEGVPRKNRAISCEIQIIPRRAVTRFTRVTRIRVLRHDVRSKKMEEKRGGGRRKEWIARNKNCFVRDLFLHLLFVIPFSIFFSLSLFSFCSFFSCFLKNTRRQEARDHR